MIRRRQVPGERAHDEDPTKNASASRSNSVTQLSRSSARGFATTSAPKSGPSLRAERARRPRGRRRDSPGGVNSNVDLPALRAQPVGTASRGSCSTRLMPARSSVRRTESSADVEEPVARSRARARPPRARDRRPLACARIEPREPDRLAPQLRQRLVARVVLEEPDRDQAWRRGRRATIPARKSAGSRKRSERNMGQATLALAGDRLARRATTL